MADLFGRRVGTLHNETGSSFTRANSMSRPSGKSIYQQRKEYTENMIKQQHDFQHQVEHLLTAYVDGKEISNLEDCIDRLKMMDAQGQVWGQGMLLQVKDCRLLLTDTEAEEELDCYPLECIQDYECILDSCIYNSILAITVEEMNLHRTRILLFQCEQIGADLLKTKLKKAIEEWTGEQRNHDLLRSNLENMLLQQSRAGNSPRIPQDQRAAGLYRPPPPTQVPQQRQEQHPWNSSPVHMGNNFEAEQPFGQPWENPGASVMILETQRNGEILNHVLNDIEIFVGKLKKASGSLSDSKKKTKRKKKLEALPPKPEFEDCFQKIKYGINLLGKLDGHIQQPSATDLLHMIFSTLSFILSSCPWSHLASSVISPLLIPEALDLLTNSLNYDEQLTWKSLGIAWSLNKAQYPEGQSVPPYMPTFSDGWVLPMPTWRAANLDKAPNGTPNGFLDRASNLPQLMKAVYEFHARNSRELNVRKGDLLEILDQRKKWWLARNISGEEGYIPNNILEPVDQKVSSGFPELQPDSTPAEVTAWLRTKGFSKITVKTLGILNGRQLLSMSETELKTVCPEEGRRVSSILSGVKSTLEYNHLM